MFDLPFELPEGWDVKTVQQLIDEGVIEKPLDGNHGGIHPKSSDYVEEGVPFVMASDLDAGKVNFNSCKFITEEQALKLRKGFSRAGDVLISHKATIGRTAIVQENEHDFIMLTPQVTYYRVKDDTKLNNVYLKAYFDSNFFQTILGLWAGAGSTRAYLGITGQLKLPVVVPPIDKQGSIANHVRAIDDKIELNRQTNQTLEQIAQAIFKSWFVDFEPIRAKIVAKQAGQDPERAAIAAISGKSLEELDQLSAEQQEQLKATAALFPEALVDSELGEIPEGWEAKPLSQMVNLIGGGTPKKSEATYWGGEIPWFSVKDAPADGDVFVIDTELKITELGLNKSSTKFLPEGTTIISARGTVGRLALVGVPTAMNQSCYGVQGVDGIGPYLNYFNVKEAVSTLKQNTHGAVFDTITRETFDTVILVQAKGDVLVKFEEVVKSNLNSIKNNLFESKALEEARDSLLPKLLSGEIALEPINES